MNYTCQSCVIDQLTLKGPMESDDLKHACRLNADGYSAAGYVSAIYDLFNTGRIVRVTEGFNTNPVYSRA